MDESGNTETPNKRRPRSGNHLRHGLHAGQLPRDAKHIEIRMNILRRNLEAAVLEARGEVTLTDAAAVQTATRWERHALLAQRWLTKQYDKLTPEQRLTFSREVAKASAERDKALACLRLDRDAKGKDMLDELYARVPKMLNGHNDGAAGVTEDK